MRGPRLLWVAVALYVGLRALLLHTAFDEVALVNYELYPMGTLPKLLAQHSGFPLEVCYDNAAGQLVTGLAAWPLYGLFGDSYLSLKLVPALAGLALLLCAWALCDAHVSRRAANLAAFALALGPSELLAKYSLVASGNHFENLFFSLLAVLCAYRLHVADPARRGRWLVLAGLSAGLAIFVFLGAIVPVGLLALVHLGVRGWRGSFADLRRWLPAFVLGLAPLIVLNLVSGARGAAFLSAKFAGGGEARDWGLVARRTLAFLTDELFRAGFHRGLDLARYVKHVAWLREDPWRVPSALLLAGLWLAWLVALPAALGGVGQVLRSVLGATRSEPLGRRAFTRLAAVPFVLLLPLTALAYGLSNLVLGGHPPPLECAGYRYFLPVSLFGVVLAAAVADRSIERGGWRRWLGLLVGAALLVPGLWNLSYVRLDSPVKGIGARYRGWNFMQAGRGLLNDTTVTDLATRARILAATDEPYRTHLARGVGFYEAQVWIGAERDRDDLGRVRRGELPIGGLLAGYPESLRLELARGMGAGLRSYVFMRGADDRLVEVVRDGLVALVQAGDPYAWAVLDGAATPFDYPVPWRRVPQVLARSQRLLELLPPALQPTFGAGLGEVAGRLLARGIAPEEEWLQGWLRGLYKTTGRQLLVGLGRGLALEDVDPRLTEAAAELTAEPELRAAMVEGFTTGLRALYDPARVEAILARQAPEWR